MRTIDVINKGRSKLVNIACIEGGLQVCDFSDFLKIHKADGFDPYNYVGFRVEYVTFYDTILGILWDTNSKYYDLFDIYGSTISFYKQVQSNYVVYEDDRRLYFSFVKHLFDEHYEGRSESLLFLRLMSFSIGFNRITSFDEERITNETYRIGDVHISCQYNEKEFLRFY